MRRFQGASNVSSAEISREGGGGTKGADVGVLAYLVPGDVLADGAACELNAAGKGVKIGERHSSYRKTVGQDAGQAANDVFVVVHLGSDVGLFHPNSEVQVLVIAYLLFSAVNVRGHKIPVAITADERSLAAGTHDEFHGDKIGVGDNVISIISIIIITIREHAITYYKYRCPRSRRRYRER